MKLSRLNQRRIKNFKANRRAVWSLWIFAILFGLSLFAEFLSNEFSVLSIAEASRTPVSTTLSQQ